MRIEAIAKPDRAGRYRVTCSDGQILRLYRQSVEDFGLCPGLELEAGEFQRLLEHAGELSAKMRAIRILSAANVSRQDLQERLVRKGEDPKQAQNAMDWMEELNLLDDRRTAKQIVERCAAKGYGLARAKQTLYEKRIPRELWQEALEDYPDQREYMYQFLTQRLEDPADRGQVKKAVDALLRRGHSYSDIRRVLCDLGQRVEEE